MNPTPFDIHSLIGACGVLAPWNNVPGLAFSWSPPYSTGLAMFTLSGLNEFIACLVGILTVIYMAIRIVICWRKL